MSFVKKYVPPISDLKKEIDANPEILKYYSKFEGFVGDSDSIQFLIQQLNNNLKLNKD